MPHGEELENLWNYPLAAAQALRSGLVHMYWLYESQLASLLIRGEEIVTGLCKTIIDLRQPVKTDDYLYLEQPMQVYTNNGGIIAFLPINKLIEVFSN